MKRFISNSRGREGFRISARTEKECGKQLLKVLPKDWKVSFDWVRFAMFDVKYYVVKKEKIVRVYYYQNLARWWEEIMKEIKRKLKKIKII